LSVERRREHTPDVTDVAEARPDSPADHPSSRPGTPPATLGWYALWVLSNAEFVVEDALRGHGIESFLPTWSEVTQWSDRKKTIHRPLFPGYLFARSTAARLSDIVRIAGVIEILPSKLHPAPVASADIDNLRRMLSANLPVTPCQWISGDAVMIDSGPLAGVRGIVQRTKDGTRVIVKIEILKRAVRVEIDFRDLVKAAA
jgi:transcriptional antiterminator NusG